ncbi:unnamed protein product, partial [Nesidiocoris tenuis]
FPATGAVQAPCFPYVFIIGRRPHIPIMFALQAVNIRHDLEKPTHGGAPMPSL